MFALSNMRKNTTLKNKMLIIILSCILFTLTILFIFELYNIKKESLNNNILDLKQLEYTMLHTFSMQDKFFAHDIIQSSLYDKQNSDFIVKYNVNKSAVNNLFQSIIFTGKNKDNKLFNNYQKIKNDFNLVCDSFEFSVNLILKRGYKDFGLEGRMRRTIHSLMLNPELKNWEKEMLSLRRHEKDFIIRNENKYVELHRLEFSKLFTSWVNNGVNSAYINELNKYQSQFDTLVQLENRIGLKIQHGLRYNILIQTSELERLISELIKDMVLLNNEILNKYKFVFRTVVVILFLFSLYLALVLSSYISKPINRLSEYINNYVINNFEYVNNQVVYNKNDEIGALYKNIELMQKEISIHFKNYKIQSEQTQREILLQKTRIEFQKLKIEEQNKLLETQFQHVEMHNKSMIDSIKYAKRIQNYLLPSEDKFKPILPESFLIFMPKDIVSGDFYWIESVENRLYIAIADCTGHGVPGAFMSILGNSILDQALFEKKLVYPNEILNFLNTRLSTRFKQNGINSEFKDGMDISLIMINRDTDKLYFSAAQRPMIYSDLNNNLSVIKGDRRPIGWVADDKMHQFVLHEFNTNDLKMIYLFSDGYYDQFGGERNRKFKFHNFKSLLQSLAHEQIVNQNNILKESFKLWKGNNIQIDDITVFGLKLN